MPSVLKRRGIVRLIPLAAIFGYLLALLVVRLGTFPNLHGDEAWNGLFSVRIGTSGIYTPHAMNTYTAPVFPWLVAQTFRLLTPAVRSLRLPGVVANAAAVLILTWHFGRRQGLDRAYTWLAVVAATPMFLVKSRVAWEVYALQNLMLAVLLVLLWGFLEEQRYSVWRVFVFLAIVHVGTLNHAIFATVPVSLAVYATIRTLREPDVRLVPLLRLIVISLVSTLILLAVKLTLSPASWLAHRVAYAGAYALLPLIFAAASRSRAVDPWIQRALERQQKTMRVYRALRGLFIAGLMAFALVHLATVVEILSGVAIFERVVSWLPPLWMTIPLVAWALLLVGILVLRAGVALNRDGGLTEYDRLLALWPFGYMAVFTAFRPTASIRHFAILIFLIMAALTPALAAVVHRRLILIAGLASVAIVHACLWREILVPHQRAPMTFHLGWGLETSKHFANLDKIRRFVEDEGVCRLHIDDFFLNEPLQFDIATRPVLCRSSQVLEAEDCAGCAGPPFVRWKLR